MAKIIDYKIVTGSKVEILTEHVKKSIAEGWQPIGGVANGDRHAWQAVVKYDNKPFVN